MDEITLALENIWIIDSTSGICIFDWYVSSSRKTIDEQLVSGLLIAFKNFSSEAGLVDISAIEGIDKKLAYKSDDRFIIAGVCHTKDYEPLINRTLLDLLAAFRHKYKKILDQGLTTDVSPFRTFEDDIVNALEGRTAPRNISTTIVGVMLALIVASVAFAAYYFTFTGLFNAGLSESLSQIIGLIVTMICMILAGIVGGIIAGDRRLGMLSGAVSTIPIIVLMVAFFQGGWSTTAEIFPKIVYGLLYFILYGSMAVLGGLFGGFIRESRNFFPLKEDEDDEEEEELGNTKEDDFN